MWAEARRLIMKGKEEAPRSAERMPIQKALNIWRGKLFHFFKFLNNQMYPDMAVISFVHLQKRNKFAKFGRLGSKNAPATPLRSF